MTAPLLVVPPLTITDAMLDSTDVPEDTNPAWSSGGVYGVDDRVYVGHFVYSSLQAGNLNHPVTDPDWWAKVGPTNRWALFDGSNSTQTAKSTSMSYTLKPVGAVGAMAVLNATGCNTVRVRVTHPTLGSLKDTTYNLASRPTTGGWWAWYYGERQAQNVLVITDMPASPGCTITVDFTGTTALAIGVLVLGQIKRIGMGIKAGARVGIDDYSRKETDDFGQTSLVQRAYAKRCSVDVPVASNLIESAIRLLNSRRALPTLYIGSSTFGSLVIFGFYKSYEVVHAYADLSELTIDLQDLA